MSLAFVASPFETTMWCPGPSFPFLSPSYPPNDNTHKHALCTISLERRINSITYQFRVKNTHSLVVETLVREEK